QAVSLRRWSKRPARAASGYELAARADEQHIGKTEGFNDSRRAGTGRRHRLLAHAALREGCPRIRIIEATVVHQIRSDEGVARLEKSGICRRQIHGVCHQLQDELVTRRIAVFVDEICPRVPQRDAPDFALVVNLVRDIRYDWIART